MPHSRFEWLDRLKSVEREHLVAAAALVRLRRAIEDGSVEAPVSTTLRDVRQASEYLEATYLVRLWAEFETAILSFFRSQRHDPDARLRARDLVNHLAGRRHGRVISDTVRDDVHEVREYRNALVHDRLELPQAVPLGEARRGAGSISFWVTYPKNGARFPCSRSQSTLV